jgi:hypothetical protein
MKTAVFTARHTMKLCVASVEMTGLGNQDFIVVRFTHLSDDDAVAKMGHPVLWLRGNG